MALHDLTPQLRTRLSRMERAVGWFVLIAVGLLLCGFGYYIYNTAERKGWFLIKAPYFTFIDRATGLKVGDPVKLMGFDAGEITDIKPMPAYQFTYNVYVEFELKWPNYEYMWTEGSRLKVTTADLLGKRVLEVTKGTGGYPTFVSYPLRMVTFDEAKSIPDLAKFRLGQEVRDKTETNLIAAPFWPVTNLQMLAASSETSLVLLEPERGRKLTGLWNDKTARYEPISTNKYWLISDESAAVTERLEQLVGSVETALPGVFALTNELGRVLSNSASLAANFNEVAIQARPAVSNLTVLLRQVDRPGGLGEWLLPTNINSQLSHTLATADSTLNTANTNLAVLAVQLQQSLENLSQLTGSLSQQVQSNSNLVSSISRTIVDADAFVEGLKHHWLLRSAFKSKPAPKTNAPPARISPGKR